MTTMSFAIILYGQRCRVGAML